MAIPLVLLPGLMCDARQWTPVTERMEPREIQIGDLTRDTSVAAMAETILAAAPPRFALAGFSMGGIVALEAQRQAPDRIAGLGLICTNARPDAHTHRAELVRQSNHGLLGQVIANLASQYFYVGAKETPRQQVIDMALRLGPAVFERQNAALSSRIDSRPLLPQITPPTLIVCGADDIISPPEMSEEMARLIPNARLVTLPACGHMAPFDRPAELADALTKWLAPLR